MLIERSPGAQIVPSEVSGQTIEVGLVFALGGTRLKHGVIDGDVFALRIELGEDCIEIGRAVGGGDLLEQRRSLRQMFAHGVGQSARAPQKNSAVPVIVAGGDELLSLLLVGLFGKAADALDAGLAACCRFRCSRSRFRRAWAPRRAPRCFRRQRPAQCRDAALPETAVSSPMTWSAGKTPSTASGEVFSIRNAASPAAGAVLRAAGSQSTCSGGTSSSWKQIADGQQIVGDDPGVPRGERAAADDRGCAES